MAAKRKPRSAPKPPQLPPGAIPLSWGDALSLPLAFVDQLHIRRVSDRYYLTFGQVNLPVVDDPFPAGMVANVRPVSRVVVIESEMERMVVAIQRLLDAARKAKEAAKK